MAVDMHCLLLLLLLLPLLLLHCSGDMQELCASVECLSSRVASTADSLSSLSASSSRRLEEQAGSLMQVTAVSMPQFAQLQF
jgi:hypothetical protein